MGLEIAGTVVAMGPEVQGFALGDRVMGIVGGGAYAELSRIDHRMAMPVPAGMDLVAAGAVAEVFVTAHEALFHLARLHAGESVLIHAAAGSVGSAAVQLAHAAGARVFARPGATSVAPCWAAGPMCSSTTAAKTFRRWWRRPRRAGGWVW